MPAFADRLSGRLRPRTANLLRRAGGGFLAACLVVGPAAAELASPSPEQRAYVAARLYQAVKDEFGHAEALPADYDLDRAFRAYLAQAMQAPDRLGFDLATMRFVATLRNGHTRFTDDALQASEPALGLYAEPRGGAWTVVSSAWSSVGPGDVIESVDSAPIGAWAAERFAYLAESSDRAKGSELFRRAFLFPRRFTLGLAGGGAAEIDRAHPGGAAMRGFARPAETTASTPRPGVLLVRIPGFNEPALEAAAVAALRGHAEATAVVFDLRDNRGGSTPVDLLDAIMDRPYRSMIDQTPLHIATFDAVAAFSPADDPLGPASLRTGGTVVAPGHPFFHGRVVVLANRLCVSACEDFALAVHNGKRGPVVGEATSGSTGQPYLVGFPELGMSLAVSTRREFYPDGSPFEGVRVAPDIAVENTADDMRRDRDAMLERALDEAAR